MFLLALAGICMTVLCWCKSSRVLIQLGHYSVSDCKRRQHESWVMLIGPSTMSLQNKSLHQIVSNLGIEGRSSSHSFLLWKVRERYSSPILVCVLEDIIHLHWREGSLNVVPSIFQLLGCASCEEWCVVKAAEWYRVMRSDVCDVLAGLGSWLEVGSLAMENLYIHWDTRLYCITAGLNPRIWWLSCCKE